MGNICVQNVGKAYKKYTSHFWRLKDWIYKKNTEKNLNWVLRDINFTIRAGESVGIIGINGAGKSTLLKMIAGTAHPTTGAIVVDGSLSALLELGIGFHQELTGRQNAFLSLQLHGVRKDEVNAMMGEIEEFANVGDYIDQPVRIYSTGMRMRLAFAVATVKRPDILIVDEALTVGDIAFQRKCFERIENFRALGTTFLLVSHDVHSVKKLCNKALYLKAGRQEMYGNAKSVCDEYERDILGLKLISHKSVSISFLDKALMGLISEKQYGGQKACIESVLIMNSASEIVNVIEQLEGFLIKFQVNFLESLEDVHFGCMLRTVEGIVIYGTNTDSDGDGWNVQSNSSLNIEFSMKNYLAPGTYFISCAVSHASGAGREIIHRRVDCALIRIVESSGSLRNITGLINLEADHIISSCPNGA
jgi:lipopolysaccharide transport system ATP-binding protein